MRRDCVLAKLTEDQQADLFDWLSTDSYQLVQKRLAQPPPEGFGIHVHRNTLFRFFKQRQAQVRNSDLSEALLASDETRAPSSERVAAFWRASQIAFAHSTYTLAHSPPTPDGYRSLFRALQQREDAAFKREFLDISRQHLLLARERLQLDRAQFEYNAARAALALLPVLNEIDRRNDIDDESKIWLARARLFGAPEKSAELPPGKPEESSEPGPSKPDDTNPDGFQPPIPKP